MLTSKTSITFASDDKSNPSVDFNPERLEIFRKPFFTTLNSYLGVIIISLYQFRKSIIHISIYETSMLVSKTEETIAK